MPTEISGRQIQDGSIDSVDIKDGSITAADLSTNVNWKAPVANQAALPVSGNNVGDARVSLSDASVNVWDGNTWKSFATSSYTTANFNTDFASKTTDDLTEGTKKYFYVHNHDDLYFTEIEVTNLLAGKSDTSHLHDTRYAILQDLANSGSANVHWGNISNKPLTFTPSSHNHDDLYFTETEITSLLAGKSDTSHDHNSVYYTKTTADATFSLSNHNHDTSYYTKTEVSTAGQATINWANITSAPTTYPPDAHNHDASYYTKTQSDTRYPVFTSGTSFPSSPKGGDECYRTDLDYFYKYNGTVWIVI